MIRRPPRSTLDRSSAASDVYKRQTDDRAGELDPDALFLERCAHRDSLAGWNVTSLLAVSYTHLRAHETVLDLVCRLLLEKKTTKNKDTRIKLK